jgi:hypothetical protein
MVQQRIDAAREAMDAAQSAANENTKSSAGDKYETGRAMMQLERDKAAAHLATAMQLNKDLENIDPKKVHTKISQGSLVHTSNGIFFVAAPLGKISHEETAYWAISEYSPVGKLLMGKAKGDSVTFNGREFAVLELW